MIQEACTQDEVFNSQILGSRGAAIVGTEAETTPCVSNCVKNCSNPRKRASSQTFRSGGEKSS